jgi:hypothetical protein
MKNFSQYLMESQRQFAFRVKVAGHDLDKDVLDRIERSLGMYDLADISKPKRLPISHTNEFPNLGAVQREVFDIKINYPANPPMIAQAIHNGTGIPACCIMVVDPDSDEVENVIYDEKGESILDKEELPPGAKDAQNKVGEKRILDFMKELETNKTTKVELAAKEKVDSKTTNDLPQNNKSVLKPNTTPRGK